MIRTKTREISFITRKTQLNDELYHKFTWLAITICSTQKNIEISIVWYSTNK